MLVNFEVLTAILNYFKTFLFEKRISIWFKKKPDVNFKLIDADFPLMKVHGVETQFSISTLWIIPYLEPISQTVSVLILKYFLIYQIFYLPQSWCLMMSPWANCIRQKPTHTRIKFEFILNYTKLWIIDKI